MMLALTTSRISSKRAIMTICSNNYLPYARILFSSVQKYHPEASLFLCLADLNQPDIELGIDGVEIIEAYKLGIPNFSDFAFRYDIMEFNTALKPFMMRYLIEERDFAQVVYLDPDIEVFAPLTPVFNAIEAGANFILTPHLTAPAEFSDFPNDIGIMKAGVYNLGFIAVSDSHDVIDFLHWWGRRLRFYCLNQQDRGIFVDQKFVDLLPGFHDNVKILRDRSLNVAYWNLDQRKLEKNENGWFVNGEPLIFFHFSGIDPNNPHRLSKHTFRFNGNLDPALKALIQRYISQLKEFGFNSTIKLSYAYGTFSNGVRITDLMRHCYRTLEEPWLENPFQTFHHYLNQPYGYISNRLITNLMHYLWMQRIDLQNNFDLNNSEERQNYGLWFVHNAEDYNIDNYFLVPILDNLAQQRTTPPQLQIKNWKADVGIIGYLKSETGVGHAARMVTRSLESVGLKIQGLNITINVNTPQEVQDVDDILSSEIDARIHIYNVNADQLAIVRNSISQFIQPPQYIINMPFWELSKFPETWIAHYDGINEIWAPTRFVQAALQKNISIPVVWMPPAVKIEDYPKLDRIQFNLPSDTFLFHFNFDFSSYSTRKNPLAAIEAYRLAFRDRSPSIPTALAIKTRGQDPEEKNLNKLLEFVEKESDIFIINEQMTYSETIALMNCCNCYISLHRCEGFGYTLAEAMLLGKPVIATDYSGNKDFLNNSTGFPVSYQLKPLNPNEYPFWEGQKWADPDLNHAAWLMRRVISDEVNTGAIALAGQQKILSDYSPQIIGQRMIDRLRKINVL